MKRNPGIKKILTAKVKVEVKVKVRTQAEPEIRC
jgi:hypothetical protein